MYIVRMCIVNINLEKRLHKIHYLYGGMGAYGFGVGCRFYCGSFVEYSIWVLAREC